MTAPHSASRVLVVGGGVSGLTLAHRLGKADIPFVLCEKSERLGGNIKTAEHDGFLYDVGPDSFLRTRPEGVKLAEELGLGSELVMPEPNGAQVFVALDGRLFPMPEGLSLGVPTRPASLLGTELVSDVGKLRAMLEPFVPPGGDEEESILAFCERRLGREMATRIAAPLLSGVFAGDARELSMSATFPQLVLAEKKHGSLFRGLNGGKTILEILRQKPAEAKSPFVSFRRGLATLVEALRASVESAGEIRLGTEVTNLARNGDAFEAMLGGRKETFTQVAIAGPPFSTRGLVRELDASLSSILGEIRGAPTATIFFGLENRALERPLVGSGFIVPPGEASILASTYISSKWAGRAPEGTTLVRAFIGGARGVGPNPLEATDAELIDVAYRELTRLAGGLGKPLFARAYCYPFGTPQPTLGHAARLRAVSERVQSLAGLHLFGPGFGGVGIPDCVRQAAEVAERIVGGEKSTRGGASAVASA